MDTFRLTKPAFPSLRKNVQSLAHFAPQGNDSPTKKRPIQCQTQPSEDQLENCIPRGFKETPTRNKVVFPRLLERNSTVSNGLTQPLIQQSPIPSGKKLPPLSFPVENANPQDELHESKANTRKYLGILPPMPAHHLQLTQRGHIGRRIGQQSIETMNDPYMKTSLILSGLPTGLRLQQESYELEFHVEENLSESQQSCTQTELNCPSLDLKVKEPPRFPLPPLSTTPQKQLVDMLRDLLVLSGIDVRIDLSVLTVKKYNDCILFKLPSLYVVWGFSGNICLTKMDMTPHYGFEYSPGQHYYEGEYEESKKQGKGIWIGHDGSLYQGEWSSNKKHGKGIYFNATDNSLIRGEFHQGQLSGFCEIVKSKNQWYRGQFKSNRKHGQGLQVYPNGDYYDGHFKSGLKEGLGTYKWSDGSFYQGKFKAGLPHGHGFWKDQALRQSYKGPFHMGMRDGKGYYRWSTASYWGTFLSNMAHGQGIFTSDTGSVYSSWQKGSLQNVLQHLPKAIKALKV